MAIFVLAYVFWFFFISFGARDAFQRIFWVFIFAIDS